MSCSNKSEITSVEPIDYLVSEVHDYNDRLIAKYFYNDKKQLVKREFTNPATMVSSDLFFEYEDNLVTEVKYVDYDFPQFSHYKYYYYLPNGRINRIDVGTIEGTEINTVWTLNFSQGIDQIALSLRSTNPSTFYKVSSSNIVQTTHLLKDLRTGEEYQQNKYFKFDDKKRPNFGLDYLIGTDLLPFRGTTSHWEKTLSKNNLIEEVTNGTKYILEYNTEGYPISIEVEKDGIDTLKPQVLKITYQ